MMTGPARGRRRPERRGSGRPPLSLPSASKAEVARSGENLRLLRLVRLERRRGAAAAADEVRDGEVVVVVGVGRGAEASPRDARIATARRAFARRRRRRSSAAAAGPRRRRRREWRARGSGAVLVHSSLRRRRRASPRPSWNPPPPKTENIGLKRRLAEPLSPFARGIGPPPRDIAVLVHALEPVAQVARDGIRRRARGRLDPRLTHRRAGDERGPPAALPPERVGVSRALRRRIRVRIAGGASRVAVPLALRPRSSRSSSRREKPRLSSSSTACCPSRRCEAAGWVGGAGTRRLRQRSRKRRSRATKTSEAAAGGRARTGLGVVRSSSDAPRRGTLVRVRDRRGPPLRGGGHRGVCARAPRLAARPRLDTTREDSSCRLRDAPAHWKTANLDGSRAQTPDLPESSLSRHSRRPPRSIGQRLARARASRQSRARLRSRLIVASARVGSAYTPRPGARARSCQAVAPRASSSALAREEQKRPPAARLPASRSTFHPRDAPNRDEGWTTVEKKAPKEAGAGGRGGGPSGGSRARGSQLYRNSRVPRNFPHRRQTSALREKETLEAAAIDRPAAPRGCAARARLARTRAPRSPASLPPPPRARARAAAARPPAGPPGRASSPRRRASPATRSPTGPARRGRLPARPVGENPAILATPRRRERDAQIVAATLAATACLRHPRRPRCLRARRAGVAKALGALAAATREERLRRIAAKRARRDHLGGGASISITRSTAAPDQGRRLFNVRRRESPPRARASNGSRSSRGSDAKPFVPGEPTKAYTRRAIVSRDSVGQARRRRLARVLQASTFRPGAPAFTTLTPCEAARIQWRPAVELYAAMKSRGGGCEHHHVAATLINACGKSRIIRRCSPRRGDENGRR